MRLLLAVAAALLVAGCQERPIQPTSQRLAWDPDAGAVILTDAITPDALAATAPGTLWFIYNYPAGRPSFVCRQMGAWRGLVEVRVTADSVYHPENAARYEQECSVKWSNRLRIGDVVPTEGRVRLQSVRLTSGFVS